MVVRVPSILAGLIGDACASVCDLGPNWAVHISGRLRIV